MLTWLRTSVGRSISRPTFLFRSLSLFFAVLFEMSLDRLLRVSPTVNYVCPLADVGMVCSLLVTFRPRDALPLLRDGERHA